jgi:hypothetical protein
MIQPMRIDRIAGDDAALAKCDDVAIAQHSLRTVIDPGHLAVRIDKDDRECDAIERRLE